MRTDYKATFIGAVKSMKEIRTKLEEGQSDEAVKQEMVAATCLVTKMKQDLQTWNLLYRSVYPKPKAPKANKGGKAGKAREAGDKNNF